jgi:hypothetical protein
MNTQLPPPPRNKYYYVVDDTVPAKNEKGEDVLVSTDIENARIFRFNRANLSNFYQMVNKFNGLAVDMTKKYRVRFHDEPSPGRKRHKHD